MFVVFLQIILCVNPSDSADKEKKSVQPISTSKEKQTRSVSKYLNASFNLAVDRVPTPFFGHNIEEVYKAIEKRKKVEEKSEFETSE